MDETGGLGIDCVIDNGGRKAKYYFSKSTVSLDNVKLADDYQGYR